MVVPGGIVGKTSRTGTSYGEGGTLAEPREVFEAYWRLDAPIR
jgi:hypothetical protein